MNVSNLRGEGLQKKVQRRGEEKAFHEEITPIESVLDALGDKIGEVRIAFDSRSINGSGDNGEVVITKSDVIDALLSLRIEPELARDCLRSFKSSTDHNNNTFNFVNFVRIAALTLND